MAINVTIYDLENYPDNSKTVTVDLKQVVPLGAGGDERWVITSYTTATASGSATIQDVFINEIKLGYSKSTGFNQGPYTINSSQNRMKVSIDGSTAREIILTASATALTGSAVAADIQARIRDLSADGALEEGSLSFSNAECSFADGKFTIKSGSISNAYTGSNKSSVRVTAGTTNNVSTHLGFLGAVESEVLASSDVDETYVSFAYTVSSGTILPVNDSSIATASVDCIGITDGTNTEYRAVSSVAAGQITMGSALSHDYAAYSRVQVLRFQDPSATPPPILDDVDDATRYAISTIVNQVDFSS